MTLILHIPRDHALALLTHLRMTAEDGSALDEIRVALELPAERMGQPIPEPPNALPDVDAPRLGRLAEPPADLLRVAVDLPAVTVGRDREVLAELGDDAFDLGAVHDADQVDGGQAAGAYTNTCSGRA